MTKHSKEEKLKAFSQLLDVVDTLREQCPWDSAQTNESIRPNTIEETMELAEALIAGEPDNIRKELGDVLLHILFYARFGEEKSQFDIADVCDSLREKLIFRHPHIYGDHSATDASQVREQWEVIKMKEKEATKPFSVVCPPHCHRLSKPNACRKKPQMWASTGISQKTCGKRCAKKSAKWKPNSKADMRLTARKSLATCFLACECRSPLWRAPRQRT